MTLPTNASDPVAEPFVPATRAKRETSWLNVLLAAAVLAAIGGVAFAVGVERVRLPYVAAIDLRADIHDVTGVGRRRRQPDRRARGHARPERLDGRLWRGPAQGHGRRLGRGIDAIGGGLRQRL